MPRSYLIFKWAVYALATLLLALLQLFVLDCVSVGGIAPFLPPMAVGVVASYERGRASGIYALAFGALCGLALPGTAVPGFYALTFTLSALLVSALAEHLLSPGFWCSLMAAVVSYLVTALGRCAVFLLRGTAAPGPVLLTAAAEFLVTLPCLLLVFPLLRLVHRRTTVDY